MRSVSHKEQGRDGRSLALVFIGALVRSNEDVDEDFCHSRPAPCMIDSSHWTPLSLNCYCMARKPLSDQAFIKPSSIFTSFTNLTDG